MLSCAHRSDRSNNNSKGLFTRRIIMYGKIRRVFAAEILADFCHRFNLFFVVDFDDYPDTDKPHSVVEPPKVNHAASTPVGADSVARSMVLWINVSKGRPSRGWSSDTFDIPVTVTHGQPKALLLTLTLNLTVVNQEFQLAYRPSGLWHPWPSCHRTTDASDLSAAVTFRVLDFRVRPFAIWPAALPWNDQMPLHTKEYCSWKIYIVQYTFLYYRG